MAEKVLIIGSLGQVGQELFQSLCGDYGIENVIASDVKESADIDGRYAINPVHCDTCIVEITCENYQSLIDTIYVSSQWEKFDYVLSSTEE